MGRQFDVVMAGDVYCDLIFTGLSGMPRPGEELFATGFDMVAGGIFTTAVTLQRLGMHVGLFTHIGTDPFSRFVLGRMEAEGIDFSLVQMVDRSMRTVTAALSFSHDRHFASFADPRPVAPTAAEVISGHDFRHLHLNWLGQLWDEDALMMLARERGATISLDCQYSPEIMSRVDVAGKLRSVDLFMPNRDEALQVTGKNEPEAALRQLAEYAPSVIVKLGGEGAIGISEGHVYRRAAMRVPVIDTTGAGDAFAGGCIYGMLSGLSFEETLKAATICGGLSVTARGGSTNVPRLSQLHEWMAKAE